MSVTALFQHSGRRQRARGHQHGAAVTAPQCAITRYTSLTKGLLVAALALLASACASGPTETPADQWPDWYGQYDNEQYYFGYGEGRSNDANMAARQARLNAQAELAENMAVDVVSEIEQSGTVELGSAEVSGQARDFISGQVRVQLTGVEADETERTRLEDDSVRVLVRLRLDRGEAAAIMEQARRRYEQEMLD